jgi:hypothetical protein
LLLGLTRLHLNNLHDVDAYHRILRNKAEAGTDDRGRASDETETYPTLTGPAAITDDPRRDRQLLHSR